MYLFFAIMLLEHNKNFSGALGNKENTKKINKFGGGGCIFCYAQNIIKRYSVDEVSAEIYIPGYTFMENQFAPQDGASMLTFEI